MRDIQESVLAFIKARFDMIEKDRFSVEIETSNLNYHYIITDIKTETVALTRSYITGMIEANYQRISQDIMGILGHYEESEIIMVEKNIPSIESARALIVAMWDMFDARDRSNTNEPHK